LEHEHHFDQHLPKSGESRTRWVVSMTAGMMVVEIAAGLMFGSMALLADGLHMASHTAALGLSIFAYVFARRRAHDPRFSFGTGKLNSLAGFASAIVLALFALLMVVESVGRFMNPVSIAYNEAIFVAFLGLVVNGISVVILRDRSDHHNVGESHHHDHNLLAAYLHVLADALTSLLAIAALLAAKYLGLEWMDPAMGIVGGILVARWSWGLLRGTSMVLGPPAGNEQGAGRSPGSGFGARNGASGDRRRFRSNPRSARVGDRPGLPGRNRVCRVRIQIDAARCEGDAAGRARYRPRSSTC